MAVVVGEDFPALGAGFFQDAELFTGVEGEMFGAMVDIRQRVMTLYPPCRAAQQAAGFVGQLQASLRQDSVEDVLGYFYHGSYFFFISQTACSAS
jgi:hypothetical protein